MLVFYNDNKASFQQFVEMMCNERDRQYREDIQALTALSSGESEKIVVNKEYSKQQLIREQKPTLKTVEATDTEDSLLREEAAVATESEYGDDNGHGALRFVFMNLSTY